MRGDPINDAWDFLVGATGDQEALGAQRPVFVGLFLILLLASGLIALARWRGDDGQRGPRHFLVWMFRLLVGMMWFQGAMWKMPLPVSGALQYWTEQMVDNAAYPFVSELVRRVALPHMAIVDPAILILELALAVSYMLGLFVRPMATLGTVYALGLWLGLYKHPGEWPWEYIFLAVAQAQFAVYGAGRSLGLDAPRVQFRRG